MASKRSSSLALLLMLNLLFFSLVSAHDGFFSLASAQDGSVRSPSSSPSPKHMATTLTMPNTSPFASPNHKALAMPNTSPKQMTTGMPMPTRSLASAGKCPRDALKLGVCADVLGTLIGIIIGNPPTKPCCTILLGLVDLEAAICLCTAIKANILGINLNIPVALNLVLDFCEKGIPEGYTC